MDEPSWCVIVVRAWREAGGFRARLLRADEDRSTSAVEATPQAAATRLEVWLEEFVSERHPDGESPEHGE